MHPQIVVILATLKGNFLYFQVFSKILGLSTMTLSSRFSDLVADHISRTSTKTKKILKKAEGRVLFVDEAYILSSTSGKDYGKETTEAMMAKMNANIDFIFAGYPCEMEDFLRVNPGLLR